MSLLRYLYNTIARTIFVLKGTKPWAWGYHPYKENAIDCVLKHGEFNSDSLLPGYGFRIDERIIEYPWLLSLLPSGSGKLLDAGSVLNNELIISHPLIADKKLFVSTLAPETVCFWEKGVSYVYEDLRETCYRDNFFDWIICLSTLEHIGFDNSFLYTQDKSRKEKDINAYQTALKEFHRILKPGGMLYLSFPFGKYLDHGWFQVFDASMVDNVIDVFSPSAVKEDHFRYEPDGWHVSTREKSKDATCFDINVKKIYDADYAAFSRAVVCLEMIK
jgi:SAM-dependent methyltransferase